MSLSSRRTFLKATGAVAAAHLSSAAHLSARPLKQPIGLQLYSLREQLPKDFEGSLAKIRAIGYTVVEAAGYYNRSAADFRKAMDGEESLDTPFTPPISLIYGLHEALEMIHAEGVPAVLARHKRLADTLRAGCNALGLPSFQQTDAVSSTVVVLQVPEKLNGSDIVRLLYERHRTVIAGSRNKLSGRVIRIGCMGDIREADVVTDLECLDSVLTELGSKVAANAG